MGLKNKKLLEIINIVEKRKQQMAMVSDYMSVKKELVNWKIYLKEISGPGEKKMSQKLR